MNPVLIKIAASSMAIGMSTLAFGTVALAAEGEDIARADAESAAIAEAAAADAREAIAEGDGERAVNQAERAVEYAPRDAEYRNLLGDAYLEAGRFASAETAFLDALTLDPDNSRASLRLALAQIALGKNSDAIGELNDIAGRAPAADVGLAFALAGNTDRAIEILMTAARAESATARERQNLALSFALAGMWNEARLVAAQDVPLGSITDRMTEWAHFVQPANSWDQVSTLLGVTASEDPGQPVALALAPAEAPSAYAAFEPVAPPAAAPASSYAPLPVSPMVALTTPVEADPMLEEAAPVAMFVPVANAAAAARQMAAVATPAPQARVGRPIGQDRSLEARMAAPSAAAPAPAAAAPAAPRVASPAREAAPSPMPETSADGGFVVQLGAFRVPENVDQAWAIALDRYARLAQYVPSGMTFNSSRHGATLQRLSISGFGSRGEAAALCGQIRGRGGECFVRADAGDAPIQLASAGAGAGAAGRAAR